jgi:mannose-1-phosphate guanylyltransferase
MDPRTRRTGPWAAPPSAVRDRSPGHGDRRLWTLILAGGDGRRLRGLVREVHGDERPKQFAAPDGGRTLLERTLDRAGLLAPPERAVVMVRNEHAAWLAGVQTGRGPMRWLFQPAERGTAVAILWGALWIAARDPRAVVAILPSDHHFSDEDAFVDHVAAVAGTAGPEATILFGAPAAAPEPGYGWIEVCDAGRPRSDRLHRVRSFHEKPSPEEAAACFARGDLWNTLVVVSGVQRLVALVAATLPDVSGLLGPHGARGDDTGPAFTRAFTACEAADFSGRVLQQRPDALLVSPLPPVGWADWGTPARVLRSLREPGVRPAWADAIEAAGLATEADVPVGPDGSGRGSPTVTVPATAALPARIPVFPRPVSAVPGRPVAPRDGAARTR